MKHLLMTLFCLSCWLPGPAQAAVNLPPFSLPTAVDGTVISSDSYRGQAMLVTFFATWCPPCIAELPLLSAFYTENKANGWQVLGLAVDKPEPVARFLAQTPVSFPVALAGLQGANLTRELGNTAGGLPFSLLFDASGQLRERKLGQLREGDLLAWRKAVGSA